MLGGAKNIVYNIRQCFFDIIFPKHCLDCGQEGEYWCKSCRAKIILTWPKICFNCKKDNIIFGLCDQCRPLYYFDGVVCVYDYENKIISNLIQAYKYHFVKDLSLDLGLVVARHLAKELVVSNNNFFSYFFNFVIMPVPLSHRRQNWRGFNQAEEIARVIANYFGLQCNFSLKRLKHRSPQAKLNQAKRLVNMKDCFIFEGKAPQKIILVDDVITTGATVNECARVLKQAGAEEILVLTIAKG